MSGKGDIGLISVKPDTPRPVTRHNVRMNAMQQRKFLTKTMNKVITNFHMNRHL